MKKIVFHILFVLVLFTNLACFAKSSGNQAIQPVFLQEQPPTVSPLKHYQIPDINPCQNVDFGPYIKKLQREIKNNWNPPKSSSTKSVTLIFTIYKSGKLTKMRIAKSSGDKKSIWRQLPLLKIPHLLMLCLKSL